MTTDRSSKHLNGLIQELCKQSSEEEWLEFKVNNSKPDEIGEYLSALSNSAALCGKVRAYLVWGIEDSSHDLVGTQFPPRATKVGNEELENWLLRLLEPKISFRFHEFEIAADEVDSATVLRLLDFQAYFDLLRLPLPENRDGILHSLASDQLIVQTESRKWNITNLGAVLLAKRLADFRSLRRKAVRVIIYDGNSRITTIKEQEVAQGYANGFEGLVGFINNLLPANEVIRQALREEVPMYPEPAVRELVANAVIHQDFSITGAGPMIEIFDDRMEITNPGAPLMETDRFLDTPPRSRNETLASFMRRIGVCEERGSGIDKVVFQTEFYQLPAPNFEVAGDNTCAVLFSIGRYQRWRRWIGFARATYMPAYGTSIEIS